SIDIGTNNTNLDQMIHQPLLFKHFNYGEMLKESRFETGIYLFDIDDGVLDGDYVVELDKILDTPRLTISFDSQNTSPSIVSTTIMNTESNTHTPALKFNRYNINENAIYDPGWEFTDTLTQKQTHTNNDNT